MAKHTKIEKQFLLKDQLFNEEKVRMLAGGIHVVYPEFKKRQFIKKVIAQFPEQELMERIVGIRNALKEFLPREYPHALEVIIKALPPALDHTRSDNDFGDFIYAPYSYFVAAYGCTKKDLKISLAALEEITKRFSAEAALRYFLDTFPEETLKEVMRWTKSGNYHVRRLASEGTRPNLPWAKKVRIPIEKSIEILDTLYSDRTRYVTRSVANHLNDLSKTDTPLVVATLKRWRKEEKQTKAELDFITRHTLRTAVKRGDNAALILLGYAKPEVSVDNFRLKRSQMKVGESLEFSLILQNVSNVSQLLMLDYVIYFKKANGTQTPKVFKITSSKLQPAESIVINKSHTLKPMTTRTLYSGEHALEIIINGQSFGKAPFELL